MMADRSLRYLEGRLLDFDFPFRLSFLGDYNSIKLRKRTIMHDSRWANCRDTKRLRGVNRRLNKLVQFSTVNVNTEWSDVSAFQFLVLCEPV